jgi:large subunit ribosomal protein L5
VINMGLGEATQNAKIVDTAADELARITGQKPP